MLLLTVGCQSRRQHGEWGRVHSYEQLIKNSQSKNYSKVLVKNHSDIMVMAIHAGDIESGTGELATSISESINSHLYIFEGHHAPDYNPKILQSGYMHLTSHKFDDPELISIAKKSIICLSIHGYPSNKNDICIGGGASKKDKLIVQDSLDQFNNQLTTCIDCCPPYLGKNPKNIVNLCKNKGIQLEMSPNLRRKIIHDKAFRQELAKSLGASIKILVR